MSPFGNMDWNRLAWQLIAIFCVAPVLSWLLLTLIEGYLMTACNWGSLERSITDASVANFILLISAGILAITVFRRGFSLTPFIPLLLLLLAWSVVVKGTVLDLMQRHSALQTWRTVLRTNTAIYAVGGVIVGILFRPALL